jgi:rRNA maturation protein Nop10
MHDDITKAKYETLNHPMKFSFKKRWGGFREQKRKVVLKEACPPLGEFGLHCSVLPHNIQTKLFLGELGWCHAQTAKS